MSLFHLEGSPRFLPSTLLAAIWLSASASLQAQALPPLKVSAAVYEFQADGTQWRKVFTPGDFARIGSLRLSPDGTRLSFDGCRAGSAWSDASLLSCKPDGSDFKVHGQGAMPNFSPDGKRISYCNYGPPYGVGILNLADQSQVHIEEAWGVQWSPISNEIAYVRSGGTVVIRNVETGESRTLFPEGGSPYEDVHYNMAWSHDGKRLAIQGRRAGGEREIAIVEAQGAEFGFQVAAPMSTASYFLAWHPGGRKIAYQSYVTGNKCSQLFVVNLDKPGDSTRIEGQPVDCDNVSLCWTPDGGKMLVISWQR